MPAFISSVYSVCWAVADSQLQLNYNYSQLLTVQTVGNFVAYIFGQE